MNFEYYVIEKMVDLFEDEEGNSYDTQYIKDEFDSFLSDVDKEDLIKWANEFSKLKPCPYCSKVEVLEDNELCLECKKDFGHTYITEL